jgi:hypothetical protein
LAETACCCCKAAGPENERVVDDEDESWDGETPPAEMASPLKRAVGTGAGSSKCIKGETVLWNALTLLDLGLSAVAAAAAILVLVELEEVDISILTLAAGSCPPPALMFMSNASLSTAGAFSLSA